MTFSINNKRDYQIAYILLNDYVNRNDNKYNNKIVKLKMEMRSFLREYYDLDGRSSDRIMVKNDGDDYIERIKCPEWVKSKADAEEWFHEEEEITYIDRGYDCTGQWFTCWHIIKYWNGNWWCWHCVGMDV